MTVLVAVPYWNAAPYVERAVRSILAQTHRDLVCVVIGDGERPPLAIDDDRLVVYSYPTNRGAYFAQDVAIWASPFEWYAPVAADDWLEPDHIERLLAQGGDLCAGGVMAHNDRICPGNPEHVGCRGTHVPHDWPRGARKPYEVGIYRTETYRRIGAHNPTERLGQDSLTLKVMRIVAPVGVSRFVTYNRLNRPGSLCTDPATDRDSPARKAMRARNGVIVANCEAIAARARRHGQDVAAAIRAYREGLVPAPLQVELDERVAGLRERLVGQAVAA